MEFLDNFAKKYNNFNLLKIRVEASEKSRK